MILFSFCVSIAKCSLLSLFDAGLFPLCVPVVSRVSKAARPEVWIQSQPCWSSLTSCAIRDPGEHSWRTLRECCPCSLRLTCHSCRATCQGWDRVHHIHKLSADNLQVSQSESSCKHLQTSTVQINMEPVRVACGTTWQSLHEFRHIQRTASPLSPSPPRDRYYRVQSKNEAVYRLKLWRLPTDNFRT